MTTIKLISSALLSTGLVLAGSTLSITSPNTGTVVTPGQSLGITVSPSGSFSRVVVVGEGAIGFSPVMAAPPYQFSLAIPARLSAGVYALTALGVSAGENVSSTPISITVVRPDAPIEIDVSPNVLNVPVGQKIPLRVSGTYVDGSSIDITRSPSTSYSSSAPGVASVDGQGNVTGVAPGSARIVVNNSLNIPVTVPQTLSITPEWPVVYASQTTQLSVFEPGMAAVAVNWSISPQVGSISPSGVYTAPRQIAAQQGITITATLKNNPSQSVSTGVAIYPPIAVSVSPIGPVSLTGGLTFRFAQTVSNALDEDVVWSISPAGVGSIDNAGLYTAPATIGKQQTVTVMGTSVADPTKIGTATVTLMP